MLTIKFICTGFEDGFDQKDMELLACQPITDWKELSVDDQALGMFPIYACGENSHVFGYLPGSVVEKCPELVDDLVGELRMHADDLDYQPAVDPALGIKIEVYDGFLED